MRVSNRTETGARLTFRVITHTFRQRADEEEFNVGGVLVLTNPPARCLKLGALSMRSGSLQVTPGRVPAAAAAAAAAEGGAGAAGALPAAAGGRATPGAMAFHYFLFVIMQSKSHGNLFEWWGRGLHFLEQFQGQRGLK